MPTGQLLLFGGGSGVGLVEGAAAGAPQRGPAAASGLSLAHILESSWDSSIKAGDFRLSIAKGGEFCGLTQIGEKRPDTGGRGKRGKIRGFSGSSRRRFLRLVQSLDRSKIQRIYFGTLTVPAGEADCEKAEDWRKFEGWRRAYVDRLSSFLGKEGWFLDWKKEVQKNGTIHLHFLLYFLTGSKIPGIWDFRRFSDNAWADVVGSSHPAHRRVGCRVEGMRSWQGVAFYSAKYLTKFEDRPLGHTGRMWGRVNNDQAPIEMEERIIPRAVGVRVRRILRKLMDRKREKWLWRDPPALNPAGDWKEVPREFRSNFLSVFRHLGCPIKRVRRKSLRCMTRNIWGYDVDESRYMLIGEERESFSCSYHFVNSAEVSRLVAFVERACAVERAAPF